MEKLTCKDLMVGDWVKKNNGYAKVTAINTNKIYFLDKLGTGIAYCAEPIQLTAEILEKNGFSLVAMPENFPYNVFDSEDKRIQVCNLTNSGDGYWNVHVDNEDFETVGGCDVRYIHEMQHLLRLCRYEKEIEL